MFPKQFICFLAVTLLSSTTLAGTRVFEGEEDGVPTFSDEPISGATERDIPPVQTYESHIDPQEVFAFIPSTPDTYSVLNILSPSQDQDFRDQEGRVQVALEIAPGLRANDQIEVLMNGEKLGSVRETQITLGNVYRGTHTLQVQIVNESGEPVAKSDAVTFYMQRTTPLLPPPEAVQVEPVEPAPPTLPELPPDLPVMLPDPDDVMAVQDPLDPAAGGGTTDTAPPPAGTTAFVVPEDEDQRPGQGAGSVDTTPVPPEIVAIAVPVPQPASDRAGSVDTEPQPTEITVISPQEPQADGTELAPIVALVPIERAVPSPVGAGSVDTSLQGTEGTLIIPQPPQPDGSETPPVIIVFPVEPAVPPTSGAGSVDTTPLPDPAPTPPVEPPQNATSGAGNVKTRQNPRPSTGAGNVNTRQTRVPSRTAGNPPTPVP